MSASREKKSRQESLAGGYVDPRTKREKDEQAKDRRSNALYIAIAVIFVIVGIVVISLVPAVAGAIKAKHSSSKKKKQAAAAAAEEE